MAENSLADIVLVNEGRDENEPGDVSVFRNADAMCGYLEHWWVEEGCGFAFSATGQRMRLDVDSRDRVFVAGKEDVPEGASIVRSWLEHSAAAVLEARRARASKRSLFGRRIILSESEQRGKLPTSIEGLIAYVGYDG